MKFMHTLSMRPRWHRWLQAALVAVGLHTTVFADDLAPVPAASELEAAMAAVKAIYADKAEKARTPAERAALAREIFGNREATANLAERYAVEATALNLATKSDDPLLLMSICDDMAGMFRVDHVAMFVGRVGQTTGPLDPAAWLKLSEKMNAMAAQCLDTNRFDEANDLVVAITSLAKRARDPKAATAAAALRKSIADRKKAQERLQELSAAANKLDAAPKDLLEFGRLLCFSRNKWAEGVRYLARADDPVLSPAATLEMKAVTPEHRLAVADAWAKCVDKAAPADRPAIRDHAASFYTEIIPSLNGLAKVKAEKSLEDVLRSSTGGGKNPTEWTVLFRSSKPDAWNTDAPADPRNYAIPLAKAPPLVKYVRLRLGNGATVIMRVDKDAIGTEVAGDNYGWNGTNLVFLGARQLGIVDRRTNVEKQTGAVAVSRKDGHFSGWGFGHRIHHGGEAELCWNGQWMPREMLEISVVGRDLTPEEQRFLLP
jgi:hypothetical protein